MSVARRVAAALVVAGGVPFFVQTAVAGESGSFSFITSYVHDYTTIEHAGQSITGGPLLGTATILESSGGPFGEGDIFGATCIVYSKSSDEGIDLDAPCTVTDTSGDMWYLRAHRSVGDVDAGGGGDGNWELLGGTGKYAGVTGGCTYTVEYLPNNRLVAMSDNCMWQKP